jgi:hypothetical protein
MSLAPPPACVVMIRRLQNVGPPRRGLTDCGDGFRRFRCAPPAASHGSAQGGFSRLAFRGQQRRTRKMNHG